MQSVNLSSKPFNLVIAIAALSHREWPYQSPHAGGSTPPADSDWQRHRSRQSHAKRQIRGRDAPPTCACSRSTVHKRVSVQAADRRGAHSHAAAAAGWVLARSLEVSLQYRDSALTVSGARTRPPHALIGPINSHSLADNSIKTAVTARRTIQQRPARAMKDDREIRIGYQLGS